MKQCVRIISMICFFVSGVIMMLVIVGYVRITDEMTIGEYDEMHMFDKNGNCLEQIKE